MVPGSSGRPDWDDLPSQAGPAPVRQAAAGINATMPASASRPLRVARSQLLRDIQVARRSEAKAISDGPSQAGSLRGLTEDFKLASCEDGAGCELQRPAEAGRLLRWMRGPAAASDSAGVIFLVINLSSAGPRRKEVKLPSPSQCRLRVGNISYPRTVALDIKITRVESKCGPITVTVTPVCRTRPLSLLATRNSSQ